MTTQALEFNPGDKAWFVNGDFVMECTIREKLKMGFWRVETNIGSTIDVERGLLSHNKDEAYGKLIHKAKRALGQAQLSRARACKDNPNIEYYVPTKGDEFARVECWPSGWTYTINDCRSGDTYDTAELAILAVIPEDDYV